MELYIQACVCNVYFSKEIGNFQSIVLNTDLAINVSERQNIKEKTWNKVWYVILFLSRGLLRYLISRLRIDLDRNIDSHVVNQRALLQQMVKP